MPYQPDRIEPRWQRYWLEKGTFRAQIDSAKPKFYVLDMFPYPSGEGLHVGHPEGYTATDIVARYRRMRGYNVLHPMGWDAFGLPAEQYAVETNTHPRLTTASNIERFRAQIRRLGFSYDWSREINTTDAGYVRWTQWIFLQLHRMGLAYEAEVPVNWCPALGTVLANEEVIDGKSERGGHPVIQLPLRQWMLRITAYADRLLDDLEELDWPPGIKKLQQDWIGRSQGARIRFQVAGHDTSIEVFTTRPDTLFGTTSIVLAPDHPLVSEITTPDQRATVERYLAETAAQRAGGGRVEPEAKSGTPTGAVAEHPVTGAPLPIWIADYVLSGYGTGAIMMVPGHDQRDYAFAKRFGFPIIEVVAGGNLTEAAFLEDGTAINSDFLNGLATADAKQRMIAWLEEHGKGEGAVTYKLRDWLFSRQRYWGEPFPVLHLEDGSVRVLDESQLPLTLPELEDFRPSGNFDTPLQRVPEWIETTDPDSGRPARRDPNTMPQWAGSCWYYLRFLDPANSERLLSEEAERYWMPVDLYIGGQEHATLHLLYARFWHKVLFDLGIVHTKEPFSRLINQGMVLGFSYRYYDDNITDHPELTPRVYASSEVRVIGERAVAVEDGREVKERWVDLAEVERSSDGQPLHPHIPSLVLEEVIEKMSKSRGNVISPDQVIDNYGADAMRLYEMFMGPLEKEAPWSTQGIQGVYRFLHRVYRLFLDDEDQLRPLAEGDGTPAQARLTARTAQGVTEDIEGLRFNTAISKLMVWVRDIATDALLPRRGGEAFVLMLAPLAPHLAEELWEKLGHPETLAYQPWPDFDTELARDEQVTMVVQVNGKVRDRIQVAIGIGEEAAIALALASQRVQAHLGGRAPARVVARPPTLVNLVSG